MDSLTGKELDLFMDEMKAHYTSPEDKEAIRKHLIEELADIKSEIADIGKALTIKEQLKDISEVVSLSYIAKNILVKAVLGYISALMVILLEDKCIHLARKKLTY